MTAEPASISVVPTAWARLDQALQARRPVTVSYHGRSRLLCPHALGWRAGTAMVLGYQTGGDTTTGTLDPDPTKRWRLLYIDQIDHLADAPGAPWGSAHNYNATQPSPALHELSIAIDSESPSPTQP